MASMKTLAMALACATALASVAPAMAEGRKAVPDCAENPAACQELLHRMGKQGERKAEPAKEKRWDGARKEAEGIHRDKDHGKYGKTARDGGREGGKDGKHEPKRDVNRDVIRDGKNKAGNGERAADGNKREFRSQLIERFDKDGDSALSRDEFAAMHAEAMKQTSERAFFMMDRNRDGKVDAGEASAIAQRMQDLQKAQLRDEAAKREGKYGR